VKEGKEIAPELVVQLALPTRLPNPLGLAGGDTSVFVPSPLNSLTSSARTSAEFICSFRNSTIR
jgi:hypothetical protein